MKSVAELLALLLLVEVRGALMGRVVPGARSSTPGNDGEVQIWTSSRVWEKVQRSVAEDWGEPPSEFSGSVVELVRKIALS